MKHDKQYMRLDEGTKESLQATADLINEVCLEKSLASVRKLDDERLYHELVLDRCDIYAMGTDEDFPEGDTENGLATIISWLAFAVEKAREKADA